MGETDLVLVCVSSNFSEQQILGNIPLSLTYKYLGEDTYHGENVSLYQADPDNRWNDFIGTFDNVTVVKYDVEIVGPQ